MKMPKQLLLINTLSVVFLIMFCSNNLYPQTESSGGLSMPFYGTVGEVIYAGKPACNNCRVSLIVDEQATLFLHCQNWTCAPYPLFCTCGAANVSKTVEDVPQGTLVETKFIKCMEVGGEYQWVELDYRFRSVPPLDADESYEIDFNMNDEWHNVGKMNFTTTAPPSCSNATPCDSLPSPPNINLIIQPNGFAGNNVCEDPLNASGFVPSGSQAVDPNSVQVNVCFNEQTQLWQYEFANEHTIDFNVVIGYCRRNINILGGILVDDYQNIPLTYPCDKLKRDLISHLSYPVVIYPAGSYVLKSVLEEHELQHKKYFKNILDETKFTLHDDMYKDLMDCEDLPNAQFATIYFNSIKFQNIYKYWDAAIERRDMETGLAGIKDEWLKERIFWNHERRTHFKIYKFIIQKIIAAEIYHNCIL